MYRHRYVATRAGQLNIPYLNKGNNAIEKLEHLHDICQSLNMVSFNSSDLATRNKSMADCRLNPRAFSCTCKAFKHHSICSHIIVAGQRLEYVDVARLLARIRDPHGRGRVRGARGRGHFQPDSDSDAASDEEEVEEQRLEQV